MKVVILAGVLGTRISEYTKFIPKPMIKVLGKPILHRIMDHFALYGHKEFFIATGYKSKIIRAGFGDDLVNSYVKLKNQDWGTFNKHLSSWERETTLDC